VIGGVAMGPQKRAVGGKVDAVAFLMRPRKRRSGGRNSGNGQPQASAQS